MARERTLESVYTTSEIIEARANLVAAERIMQLAMVDGTNVHGAIGELIAAEEAYADARINERGTLDYAVKQMLDSTPGAYRQLEDGRENLVTSFIVTFAQMRDDLDNLTFPRER